ncbi:MAG: FAD-binding oxidoreductase, partial [Melioribacteraceae bacterium]|nr:FAD-binding oxidoreductase [Melioribacteraceae bacterium]
MIIKSEKTDFESYLQDAANIMGHCEKVYLVENEDEISEILRECNKTKTQVTISGARTGLAGGSVPDEGVLISIEKMNKIISIDEKLKIAFVQPGVRLGDFQNEIQKFNLFYPPDPTETNCSIGGNVSTNASGARSFKYGSTREFVYSLKVVLPTGTKISLKRGEYFISENETNFTINGNSIIFSPPNYSMPPVKHAAGYFNKPNMDLIDLFIGSEGTLGVITEIGLKLISLPASILSMIIFFDNEENLFSFVNSVKRKSRQENEILKLREIEFFDKYSLKELKSDFPNIIDNAEGAVWIEQEYSEKDEEALFSEIDALVLKYKGDAENLWFAVNEKERAELKNFRHKLPLRVNDIISGRGLIKVGTDTSVPDETFAEFYSYCINLFESNNIDYVAYGHIGNSHLHFNMLPKTREELKFCRELYAQICTKSLDFGGTISAEHGIGKLKTKYLLEMFG